VNLPEWPFFRQIAAGDRTALGSTAASARTAGLAPRTRHANRVVKSICPYCAVGCAQDVYVRDGRIIDIEGDPDSPVSRGCLCPKGSATFQLVTGSNREHRVLYRRPGGTAWEAIPLQRATEMVADRVMRARESGWQERGEQGDALRRTLAMAHLGGATLDNEENYLIKKLFTALGIVQIENQARI
jgi:formate dehydrogenase major subunit